MEKFRELVDELALKVLTVEAEDLPAMGEVLKKVEELLGMAQGEGQRILELVKGCLEKLLLEELQKEKGQKFLVDGLKALQAHLRGEKVEEGLYRQAEELGLKEREDAKGKEEEVKKGETPDEISLGEDVELLQGFIVESRDHLSTIEVKIVDLEQWPDDPEVLNAIFRPFHTIKGVAGFLNLRQINRLAHALEDMLDGARKGEIAVTSPFIDLILEGVDLLKAMIDDLEEAIKEGRTTLKVFPVEEFIKRIEGVGEPSEKLLGEILVEGGAVKKEDVEEALKVQRTSPQKRIGEILVEEGKATARDVAHALREQRLSETTLKVEARKLDNLMDMIGELVIAQSMIRQNPTINSLNDPKLQKDLGQLFRITLELQKTALSLRMVPIKQTFQRMIRLVRDLAKKADKRVELRMYGEETEIDRNMVEEIYDPLLHMVRNAVDHGIEPPEERKEKGKPETGLIELRAYHKGGNIVIEISDDGRGLDRERILKKARERGLVGEEELSDQEVLHLIFQPGFSTAEKVTEVSGRGVGMDVVKRVTEKLRGRVEIATVPDRGTTFTIRLPLTLAIIDGMVIRLGEERYIIPTLAIYETLRPSRGECFTVAGKGEIVKVRDELIPLVRLHHIFGLPDGRPPWEALVVVVENEGKKRCFLVDEVLGKQEVVIKSLGEVFEGVRGVAGGAIMGDGRVGLILDVAGIFALSERGAP